MRLSKKTALITGGSRGIGRAISERFANEGARVVINYVSDDMAARKCLETLHGRGHGLVRADIGDADEVRRLFEETLAILGQVDILVVNAAIHDPHPIDQVSYSHWQKEWKHTLAVNLLGAANLTYQAAQHMISEKSGRIIYISSRGAVRGEPDQPAYGASKGGINALMRSMAVKLAPHNIGVGAVAPGFVATDMVADLLDGPSGAAIRDQSPFRRVASPEEVANAALYLADPDSLWSSGTIIDVNGASYFR